MSAIKCSAPDCAYEWPAETPPDALLRLIELHARTAHPAPPPPSPAPTPGAVTAEKVKRPTVSAAGTLEDWSYFLQRWSEYKAATHLAAADCIYQLLECCDDDLHKDLARTFGDLTSKTELQVKNSIKTLAVRQENTMVARVQLQQLRQDRDEPIRAFSARLRGQASICCFKVQCACGN